MRIPLRAMLSSMRECINPIPLIGIALVLLFGWLIIVGDQGIFTWRKLRQKKVELTQQAAALTNQLRDMEEESKRLQDPHYLEPIIRQELGYARPGELIFQFPEEPAAAR